MLGRRRLVVGSVFFFQAEDGIRDVAVTGVQTCALPISAPHAAGNLHLDAVRRPGAPGGDRQRARGAAVGLFQGDLDRAFDVLAGVLPPAPRPGTRAAPPEQLFHSPASAARGPAFPEEALAESPASEAAEERPEEIAELAEVLRSAVDGVPAVLAPPGTAEHLLPAAAVLAKVEDP